MQYKKLTPKQRNIKRWREKRNHLVCQLIEKEGLPSYAARAKANKSMRSKFPK